MRARLLRLPTLLLLGALAGGATGCWRYYRPVSERHEDGRGHSDEHRSERGEERREDHHGKHH